MNLKRMNLLYLPEVVGKYEPDDPAWQEVRKTGIGASESPSVLEVEGAFSTPLKVWASKVGVIWRRGTGEEMPDERSEAFEEMLRFGHVMEPTIACELQRATGCEVIMDGTTYRHPEYGYITATPDAWIELETEGWALAELKNVSEWTADQWEDGAPLKYQVQLQHQMLVTGAREGVIAAIIGGNRFKYVRYSRDDEFIHKLSQKLTEFWNMVAYDEMPNPTGPDVDTLKMLHEGDGEVIELPPEAVDWDEQIVKAKEQIKKWEQIKSNAEASLWASLESASAGVLPGGGGYRVVTVTKEPYSVDGTTYKYLRRTK
jgi:predicted phage-related endonuclease